jgi:outer membrane protein assembly factor BamB
VRQRRVFVIQVLLAVGCLAAPVLPAALPAAHAASASMTVTPAIVSPASVVSVSGYGLPANVTVSVWVASTRVRTVTTSARGAVSKITVRVPIPTWSGLRSVSIRRGGAVLASERITVRGGWPEEGGDAGRSFENTADRMLTTASVRNLTPGWHGSAANVPDYIGQPTMANGVLYTVCESAKKYGLCARDAHTGAIRWWVSAPRNHSDAWIAPVVARGRVFVGWDNFRGGPAMVRAYATSDGRRLWQWVEPKPSQSWLANDAVYDVVAYHGGVFVTTDDGYLTGLDASTGRPRWHRDGSAFEQNSVTIQAAAYGYLYASNTAHGGAVFALSPRSGAVEWSAGSGNSGGTLTVGAGRILTADQFGIAAFSAKPCGSSPCRALWQHDLIDVNSAFAGAIDAHAAFLTEENQDANTGELFDYDPSTGRLRWRTTVNQGLGTVTRTSNVVFVAAYGPGTLYAYPTRCRTGCAAIWHVNLGTQTFESLSGVTVNDGDVYIQTRSHGLRSFRLRT